MIEFLGKYANHCLALPSSENGNSLILIASFDTPLTSNVSQISKKFGDMNIRIFIVHSFKLRYILQHLINVQLNLKVVCSHRRPHYARFSSHQRWSYIIKHCFWFSNVPVGLSTETSLSICCCLSLSMSLFASNSLTKFSQFLDLLGSLSSSLFFAYIDYFLQERKTRNNQNQD